MPASNKELVAYLAKKIETFTESALLYRRLAKEQPSQSARYAGKAESYESTAVTLTHVKFFAETGDPHPDTIVKILHSKPEQKTTDKVTDE
jgi:cell division protein FtsX